MKVAIVGGALANKPWNGGEAWVRLSWLRGIASLGFDTYLLERIDPAVCTDGDGAPASFEASRNRRFFETVCRDCGLAGRAALLPDRGEPVGLSRAEIGDLIADATLLVNVSGHLPVEDDVARIPTRAYVDLDPGFTQFWAAAGVPGSRLAGHTHYFSVGERIGGADCPIPTLGLRWRPVRQPVCLDDWPVSRDAPAPRFTTVGSWRGAFGPVTYDGTTYGVKAHEFRRVAELPLSVDATFEAALAIDPADDSDRKRLLAGGWHLVDPAEVANHPSAFREYVSGSLAEFSVAQGVYVATRSGWFSDRSVRYLAAGKPVLLQDTGFAPDLVADGGIIAFDDAEGAARGAVELVGSYEEHARAARRLAETRFAAPVTVGAMLDEMGVAA
jgi:hypothetical protein